MPETRYIITFKDGVEISRTPYQVSDAQLLLEAFQEECNSEHTRVVQGIAKWGSLTASQKDQLLKLLAKFYILAGVKLELFSLE